MSRFASLALTALPVALAVSSCAAIPSGKQEAQQPSSDRVVIYEVEFDLNGTGPYRVGTPFSAYPAGSLTLQYSSEANYAENSPVATGRGCEQFGVPGYKGMSIMFEQGKLARIDVYQPYDESGDTLALGYLPVISKELTRSGPAFAPIGNEAETAKDAFGPELKTTVHPYLDVAGSYLEFFPADKPQYGLIMETEGDTVRSFRVGEANAVRYIEGCL